jgi:AcrR family transcriptional regulator
MVNKYVSKRPMGKALIDRPAKQPRRSQAERREASEQRLLLAAAELIAEEGFAAASLQRIGERAGYSRGLASQHFGSKDGLMQALIAAVIARSTALLDSRATAGANGSGPLAAILAYADVILEQIERDPLIRAYWVMMASAIANRLPSQAVFLAEHEKVKLELSGLIEAGQAAGEIDPGLDPEAAALSIGSTLLGIGIECLLDKRLDLPRVRTATLSGMARSLARSGSTP